MDGIGLRQRWNQIKAVMDDAGVPESYIVLMETGFLMGGICSDQIIKSDENVHANSLRTLIFEITSNLGVR